MASIITRLFRSNRDLQLDRYNCLDSLFQRPDVITEEGKDLTQIILSYLPVFEVNTEMQRVLEMCKWDISTLSDANQKYFNAFKRIVTEIPPIPYAWSDTDSCRLIDCIPKVINEMPSLQKLSISDGMSLKDKQIFGWFWDNTSSYNDVKTGSFYRSFLRNRGNIQEIAAKFPITSNVLDAITSKPDLTSFSLSPHLLTTRPTPLSPNADEIIVRVLGLRQLRSLTLNQCGLHDLHVNGLAQEMPLIDKLSLSGNLLTDASISSFSAYVNLRTLDISNNQFTMQGITRIDVLRKLQILSLAKSIQSDGHLVRRLLEKVPVIEELDLEGCSLDTTEIAQFGYFPKLKRLKIGYYWGSQSLSPAVEGLRKARPDLEVEFEGWMTVEERDRAARQAEKYNHRFHR